MPRPRKQLTVGELRQFLEGVPPETELTFGSSRFRKRPLIFYRFKNWDDDKVLVCLEELDKHSEPISEIDCRPTAEDFLEQLRFWKDTDFVVFSDTIDAVPLEFRSLSNVVSINLEQNEEPQFIIED